MDDGDEGPGEALRDEARAWLEADPDPATRAELQQLLDAWPASREDLTDRFSGRLQFGTAGLRGALGAGPMRMNRLVVRRAAAGLAVDLLARRTPSVPPVVAIGFDARHGSAAFADDTARVLAAAGVRALVLAGPLPTPVLAFAVRHLDADAGVMVTASHNPGSDNGYKVYVADGAQVAAPDDTRLSAAIDAVGAGPPVPLAPPDHPLLEHLGDEVVAAYVDAVVARRHAPSVAAPRIAHTSLHGVGAPVVRRLWAACGWMPLHEVAAQADADPAFPTVRFPNPEEPGAMDLLLEEARRSGATLAIANDPDADRLAVAVASAAAPGGWRTLTGDELGWLLAQHVLRHTTGDDRLVACSLVSSSLLGQLAAAEGVRHVETLTGFKWIARADRLVPGSRFVFGYEEALGYDVHDLVRDKDGMSAAVAIAEAAGEAAAHGRSLLDELADLEARYGAHRTGQVAKRFDGPGGAERMATLMGAIRRGEVAFGGRAVLGVRDLAAEDPPADVVVVRLEGGGRVAARPSGTEPKVKLYLEVVAPDGQRASAELASLAAAVSASLEAAAAETG